MIADANERVLALLDARVPFCLATVVSAPPSVAPAVGSKLVVQHDGATYGTLGGGHLEAAVVQAAIEQLRREEIGVARFSPQGEPVAPRRALRDATPQAVVEIALEPMLPPPHLIVVGAGHIAVPLCKYAKIIGFEVTIIDDRARFASRERFPEADHVIADDFERAIAAQSITPWTYLVLVTRGHEHDEATLRHVIESPSPYIGMIGSRRRVLLVFQRLQREGISEQLLDRVFAPIGLDIGARWPEEIALAIMAEIVNVRRHGHGRSLALRQRQSEASSPA